ncbi:MULTISPECIES: DUF4123 domain-containing protein [Acidiphilium]|uniref:DUF4123 domain-containing protein n=1 Tax=Acidiphilium rubrum TaxID=526 RepID=A0A8G2CP05_ACIRU|nr:MULTISPECIES: DUF4123 domain-containing protein [Acidiphilium]SIR53255.1 protein of unknown function [Acidiphilium rubrum]
MNLTEQRELFWPSGDTPSGVMFAVVDAARDPKIPDYLTALGTADTCQCLWQGDLFLRAGDTAPYLVRLDRDATLTRILMIEGAGKGWMLPLRTEVPFETLRSHCRRFPDAQLPDGRIVLFRWYDSRVLHDLLPALDPEECRSLFGPITTLWTENPAGDLVAYQAPPPGSTIALPPGLFPIRPTVMDAMTHREQRTMDQRIATFLQKELPEKTRSIEPPRLLAWVGRMRGRAAPYGVISERGLMKWMLLGVFLGQDFDEQPVFRSVLESPDIQGMGDERIETIFRAITARTVWD